LSDKNKLSELEDFVLYALEQTDNIVEIQTRASEIIEDFGIAYDLSYEEMWEVLEQNHYEKHINEYGWKIEVEIIAPDMTIFIEYAEQHYEKELNCAIVRAYRWFKANTSTE